MFVFGEECAKTLTSALQEIERTQLVGHQIEEDRKIDPAHANENVHIQENTLHMALYQIFVSALPTVKLQLIPKNCNLCYTLIVAGPWCSSTLAE